MALRVRQFDAEGIIILRLKGKLAFGDDPEGLSDSIAALAKDGKKDILLDLNDVDEIDETGLAVLQANLTTLQAAGGSLKLLSKPIAEADAILIGKIHYFFDPIYEDEDMAISSFFPDREVRHFDILEFVRSQQDEPSALGDASNRPQKSDTDEEAGS